MKLWKRRQRLVTLALAMALLASLTLASASGLAVAEQEMLQNGDFESGFTFVPNCGNVGTGWGCFTNGGSIKHGFYDDQWAPVVAQGVHAQLIELNTKGIPKSESDRFAGIYQTVNLNKGSNYQFKIQGMLREDTPDSRDDPWRYRVQWGYTSDGSTDWQAVTNWAEFPWDNYYPRTSPGAMQSFSSSLVAPSDKITLFVRVWKKWGTTEKELDVDLDAISLWGPKVGHVACLADDCAKPPQPACDQWNPCPPVNPCNGPCENNTETPPVLACSATNLAKNGNFEWGFNTWNGFGDVGKNWKPFTNGGAAGYGFYNEMWAPVVQSPTHGQLIEINTKGLMVGDQDRYAGIYQVITGLKPGATYQFSMWGELREDAVHPGDDPFRYRVQWGFASGSGNAGSITNWTEVPWNDIFVRTSPGPLSSFSTQFVAPSSRVVLGIRGWKKWGNGARELDINLDDISLQPCSTQPQQALPRPEPKPCPGFDVCPEPNPQSNPCPGFDVCPGPTPEPGPGECLTYIIQPGDTLGMIAVAHHTSVAALAAGNGIANPNLIYIGQQIVICPPR